MSLPTSVQKPGDDTPDPLATVDRLARYLAAYRERYGVEPHQLVEFRTSSQEVAA